MQTLDFITLSTRLMSKSFSYFQAVTFCLLHFALHFSKILLNFATKVITLRVYVTFHVKSCYISRQSYALFNCIPDPRTPPDSGHFTGHQWDRYIDFTVISCTSPWEITKHLQQHTCIPGVGSQLTSDLANFRRKLAEFERQLKPLIREKLTIWIG